ncbi:uncharacterized protein LOC134253628 [Saccostrea cucullata]|uniref:uncharacterized protein LOC134253628 n=1 Tax=Saccostrea cuccullata TaxID=36930 RepID=UPI002ED3EA76
MSHGALTVSGLFFFSSKVLTLLPGTPDGCMHTNGTRYCCSGFYELNDKCHECLGSLGYNCTSPCPSGSFGPRCMESCACPDEECNKVLGCIEEKLTTTFKGLLFLHFIMDTAKENVTSGSKPENGTISHQTNITTVLSFESMTNDFGVWEHITNLINKWMHWFIILVIVICLTIFGICIIKCRNERIKMGAKQRILVPINQVFEEQQNNHGNVYTDMQNENLPVYADINTIVDETSRKEYMQRSHFSEYQKVNHDYRALDLYTDMSDIQTNAYIDILPDPENIDGCGYMSLNDLCEKQTDNHAYHDINERVSKDMSHVKDSELNEHGSTEHVYMHTT